MRFTWNASDQTNLLATTKGFRVTIHHHMASPDVSGEGIDIGVNMNSNIGIRKKVFERLRPEEGGDCVYDSYLQNRFSNGTFMIENLKYSFQVKIFVFPFIMRFTILTIS